MSFLKKILFLFLLVSVLYIPNTFAATTTNLDSSRWNGVVNYFKTHYPNFNKEKIIEICNSYTSSFASDIYYTCSFTLRETTSSAGFSYSSSRWLPQFFIYTYSTDKIFNARYYGLDFYGNYNDNNTPLNSYSYYYRPNGTFFSDVSSSEGRMSYDWFINNTFANGGWVIYSVVFDSNFTNKYYNFVSGNNFMLNDRLVGPDYNNGVVPFDYLTNAAYGDLFPFSQEPTYTYTSNILENGNVELTFTFENYDNANSSYAFTIENELSGEEYGEENHFSSIFPKVIPYGNSYTITIPYDTYLYITLAKYNQVDNSTLYTREEIFTDVIDINNIVFANPSTPYFSIDYQSQTFIQGQFNNTQNNDSCFVKFSDDSTTRQVSCTNSFSVDFDFNGYLTFYVERNNDIIYNRNINVLGNTINDYPYLTYNIQKQDFYSVITFNVVNDDYDINMSYRYSLDNGVTWSEYQLIDKTPPTYSINIFSNSNVIFEIVNARDTDNIIVYDSKSVYVVIDISTASGLNSSTDNIIDKFISLISLNDNLINYINLSWNSIKNSKLFLPIMIPFISSIICAIIYLIRRK